MSDEAVAYFNKAVMQYSKGDVVELLDTSTKCAGPLLAVVSNGIDLMGGLCFSFERNNSSKRSVNFMVRYMNIDRAKAEFLYSCVRCGLVHQGMPKIGVQFFLRRKRFRAADILFKDTEGGLWLDVVQYANSYLDAIDHIANNPGNHVRHMPVLSSNDKAAFRNAYAVVTSNLQYLAVSIADNSPDFASGDMSLPISGSAYDEDEMLNPCFRI